MQVQLLYYTPEIHKLTESTMRICYQSFHKLSPDSHKALKSIMSKGHLSVATTNNIVFGVTIDPQKYVDQYGNVLDSLNIFKQINSFVRWTDRSHKQNKNSKYHFVISMNLLTLIQLYEHAHEYEFNKELLNLMLEEIKKTPEIYWFIDDSVEITPSENPYKLEGELGKPHLLAEDYTALKNVLTPYELDNHVSLCFHFVFDRATSLQQWRHRLVGGTEMSQRYVDQANASFRVPSDLDDEYVELYKNYMQQEIDAYGYLKEKLSHMGKKRSQEIARNLLPNVLTSTIQSRQLKDWKHYFQLRDSNHAQKEIMEDTQALKKEFEKIGISLN